METDNSYKPKPCDVKSKPPDPGYAQSRWEKFPPFGSVLGTNKATLEKGTANQYTVIESD